jgi:hypothetical protein
LETIELRVPNQNIYTFFKMITLDFETALPLDALRQQVPSTISNGRPVSVNNWLVSDTFTT